MLLPTICMLSAYSVISPSKECYSFPSLRWYSLKKCITAYAELSAASPQWLYRQKTDSYPSSRMNFLQPKEERLSMIWLVWNQVQSSSSRFPIAPLTQLSGWLSLWGQRMQVSSWGGGNLVKTSLWFQASFSPSLLLKGQNATYFVRKRNGATELLLIFSERWWITCSERGNCNGGNCSLLQDCPHFKQQNFTRLLQPHVNFSLVFSNSPSKSWLMCSPPRKADDFQARLLKVQLICSRRKAEGQLGLLMTFRTYRSFSIFFSFPTNASSLRYPLSPSQDFSPSRLLSN